MPDRDNVLPLPRRDKAAPRIGARATATNDSPAISDPAIHDPAIHDRGADDMNADDKLVPAVVFQVQRLRRQLTEGLDLALDASREIRDSFAQLEHHLTEAERRKLTAFVARRLQPDQQAAALHQAAQRSIRDGDLAEMERIRDALLELMSTQQVARQIPVPALSWSQMEEEASELDNEA